MTVGNSPDVKLDQIHEDVKILIYSLFNRLSKKFTEALFLEHRRHSTYDSDI